MFEIGENLKKDRSAKNVVCFTNNHWLGAVSEVRLKVPLQMCGFNVIKGNENDKLLVEDLSNADFVVIQRDIPRYVKLFFHILNQTRKYNIPLIYEIDDLVFDLPNDHPDRKINHYTSGLMGMLTAISKADLVTTSSHPLANFLLPFNPNVRVLRNFLIDSYWFLSPPKEAENKHSAIIIGYAATGTHNSDLQMILPALITIGDKYGSGVIFKFWGITPPSELSSRFQVQSHPETNSYIEYAQNLCKEDVDILIAPLKSNAFGTAKSPLKFLEYSALGAPAIYSRTLPYENVVTHGENGFLASSPEEWVHYIERLIESPQLRFQIAIRAQEHIKSKWLLSQHASEWALAYHEAINLKGKVTDAVKLQEETLQNVLDLQVSQVVDYQIRISELTAQVSERERAYQDAVSELVSLKTSRSWRLLVILVSLFRKIVPPGTFRDRMFTKLWKSTHLTYRSLRSGWIKLARLNLWGKTKSGFVSITPVVPRTNLEAHSETIDVIVCVHNALLDVRNCLESVIRYTSLPYSLIIVDDGSDIPTQSYLREFVKGLENCILIRNDRAGGYTRAANQGLKQSKAEYVILLNSDTLVGPEWVDRLCLAMKSDERNGIVGPLSNTASWQSIPRLSDDGDWALNKLPDGVTAEAMSHFIARYSARLYFQVPLLNGFCMMVRREVINDIGYFDEDNFGEGYGEEDDFNLRAQNKGWKLAIADDVYVYHAQSKSYSDERRHRLSLRAGRILREKHGEGTIHHAVQHMHPNRILEGIRALSHIVTEREKYINMGRAAFEGKKVLFVLPVMDAGGGANVVIDEARAMRAMGVDAQIYNETEYKKSFLSSYPHLDIPANFGKPHALLEFSRSYDAVIATANYSVEWLKPLESRNILGYYIQGFESLMYPKGSSGEKQALASYSLIHGLKRFTKTEWVRQTVLTNTKMDSDVIGISVNIDLFRPRDARPLGQKPVTVAAMIRPESPYRSPELTMAVLRRLQKEYGRLVNVILFGTDSLEEHRTLFQLDFDWQLAGKLTQRQVANLLSQSDIFVDFSTHQAMGLTALEAMACGCAVIVPQQGGAIEFVRHGENGLVVPMINQETCYHHLKDLVENDDLRKAIQLKGLKEVVNYYPEQVAYKMLRVLFGRH